MLQEQQNRLFLTGNGQEVMNQTPRSNECPKCGGSGWIWIVEDGVSYCTECSCGIRRKIILQNQLKFAEMPEIYKDACFKNMRSSVYKSQESKDIFAQSAKAIKYWFDNLETMQDAGMGLYLYSSTKGSGKTRAVCMLANEIIRNYQKSVKFTTSLRILDEIKSTWGMKSDAENRLLRDLSRTEILVIDDFGADSGKDWINEKFYGIINGRYVDKKVTIFTSNYQISNLKYDDRIKNRVLERSYEIPFPEESVREHIAEKKKREMIDIIRGKTG